MTHTIDGRAAKGTAVVARKYVETLLQHRDEFELTFIHYERCDDPIYSHGVREVILPTIWPRFLNRRSLRQTLYLLTTRDRYDIFHWGQPRLYPLFWRAPARHLVVTVHGVDSDQAEPFNLMTLVYRWTLKLFSRRVAAAIAVSSYSRGKTIPFYSFRPEQVRTITNGVEPSFAPASQQAVDAARRTYGLPPKFFLNVSRLNPAKNAFRVIRAFDRFCRQHPESSIHFVNVGDRGFEEEQVRSFIAQSPYRERIHLVGYVEAEDLAAIYTAAFALVFPLLNDGFGLPLLEAMACGTPTVGSITASPEITDGGDALLVDPFSEEQIADAMAKLEGDAALRQKLIANGFATASANSWQATGDKVLALYRELAAR